jgi:hypothetical protein
VKRLLTGTVWFVFEPSVYTFVSAGKFQSISSANYLVHIAMGKAPFLAPYFIFAE